MTLNELWQSLAVAFWCLPLPLLALDFERRKSRTRLVQVGVFLLLAVSSVLDKLLPGGDESAPLVRNLLLVFLAMVLATGFLRPAERLKWRIWTGTAALMVLVTGLMRLGGVDGVRAATVLTGFALASAAIVAPSYWVGIPLAAAAFCYAGGQEKLWLQVVGELALLWAMMADVRLMQRAAERETLRKSREELRPQSLMQALSEEVAQSGETIPEDRMSTLLEFAQTVIRADGGAIFHYREDKTSRGTLSRRLVCAGADGELRGLKDDPQACILAQMLLSRLASEGERLMRTQAHERVDALVLSEWKVPHLLFAAIRAQGRAIGLLVLSHNEVRPLDAEESGMLEFLSQQAAFSLHYDMAYQRMVDQTRLVREFEIASRLQRSLLPASQAQFRNLEVQARMDPAREVGGDYYDIIPLTDGRLIAVIGDVTGKGLPAGMIMLIVRTILHVLLDSQSETAPHWLIAQLNARLWPQLDPITYVSFLCLRWNPANRSFNWSGAGHEHLLVWSVLDGTVQRIRSGGLALGLRRDNDGEWADHELFLVPGDVVLLFTDGVTEARNLEGEPFGLDRLVEAFSRHASASENLVGLVRQDLESFAGRGTPDDDCTLLALKIS